MQQTTSRSLSRWWLLLGTIALAVAGLFSLVLVVARTPQLKSLPGFSSLFHQALVVHVDLSVLVWFLAIACLLWSLLIQGSKSFFPFLEEGALICFGLGMAALALSPLDRQAEALMSNYIPVLHSPIFFVGLALIFSGLLLMLLKLLSATQSAAMFDSTMQFGLRSAGLITLMALAAFFWSYFQMPPAIDGQQYYELAFWGGGHVLQFTHTQVMMVCWLLLASALPPILTKGGEKYLYLLFGIGVLAALVTPVAYILYDVTSQGHRLFFTHVMIAAGGIAPMLLALWIAPSLWRARMQRKESRKALWSALLMSLILFVYGGVLGAMIEGQNVIIPAHYHGSIVGVTLAFMGVAYLLLPTFGYRDAAGWKLAYWQPIVYGVGQLMHISGLAYSGGYGVLRKTPGEIAEIAPSVQAALGFMGLGGLLAIIGGFMFVVVIAKAVCCHPERSEGSPGDSSLRSE